MSLKWFQLVLNGTATYQSRLSLTPFQTHRRLKWEGKQKWEVNIVFGNGSTGLAVQQSCTSITVSFCLQGVMKRKSKNCQTSLLKTDLLAARCVMGFVIHDLFSNIEFCFPHKICSSILFVSTWHIQWTDSNYTCVQEWFCLLYFWDRENCMNQLFHQ